MLSVDDSHPGWRVASDKVDLFITENGGHMAPVTFDVDTDKSIQPYYISPWQNEDLTDFADPVLAPLRGDFFCMPFGGNAEEVDGEQHSGHGEAASARWQRVDESTNAGITTLTLQLPTTVRKGKITKKIHLRDGQNAVYTTHTLEGYSGRMPIGHHCTLAVPEEESSLRVAVSDFELGMTPPCTFSNPANAEYQSLAIGARFTDLTKVPVMWKDAAPADCSRFPQRPGFTDLLQLLKKPSATPAWTVAVCPSRGYLWFSLKEAAILPGTVFWISNKGRYGSPWNGRNRCLGLEETCSHFADGLSASITPNDITDAGFPTAIQLSADNPTAVNFIQGAAGIPPDFDGVTDVTFGDETVTFISETGSSVVVNVNHSFLKNSTFDD
ncbi:MAG: hypothetical protein QGH15_09765 [Kiritimatiellia bacterium]|jgi:hypothetical protein|nr:hypothetical protein [Kiritimatiellia bacterium]